MNLANCCDEPSRRKWTKPLFHIILVLIVTPGILTYFQIRYQISRVGLCTVGRPPTVVPSSSSSSTATLGQEIDDSVYGLYAPVPGSKTNKPQVLHNIQPTTSIKPPNSIWNGVTSYGWPSVHILDRNFVFSLAASAQRSAIRLEYLPEEEQWCLFSSKTSTVACHGTAKDSVTELPPSGVYSSHVQISCPVASPPHKKKKKKNRRNKNVEQVVNRPATTFLLLLNTYLAFRYWNDRVSPSSVAKIYSHIVPSPPHELWRAYSGALAHFDVIHLGFNMMNLYSLGEALEGLWGGGSVSFLYWNVSLVVLTTAVMMGVSYWRLHARGEVGVAEGLTVGYSGVLFAWMVVVTMQMPDMCPIPFMPDLCFKTYSLGPLKFNISPLVQLLFAQMVVRRASFVGHLAGIAAGFLIFWGVLPLWLVAPPLLIPAVFLGHLALVQGVIGFGRHAGEAGDEEEGEEEEYEIVLPGLGEHGAGNQSSGPASAVNNARNQGTLRLHSLLKTLQKMLLFTTLCSLLLFDFGMVTSQMLTFLLFHFGAKSFLHPSSEGQYHMTVTAIILRWYIVSSVILLLSDAMSAAAWCTAPLYISTQRTLCFGTLQVALLAIILRMGVNLMATIVTIKVLADSKEFRGGIFVTVLGWPLLNNARTIGDVILAPVFNAFEGRGVSLGGNLPVGTLRDL